MASNKWIMGAVCALTISSAALTASADTARPRFVPITEDMLTDEQKALPGIKRALEGGTWNPNGFDALMLRNPGLQQAQLQMAMAVMMGTPDRQPALSKELMELTIMLVAGKWQNATLSKGHAPAAIEAGLTQAMLDAIAAGERPPGMNEAQAAVHDFATELLNTHRVKDDTFASLKEHLGEPEIVDLIAVMGMYTSSVMLMNVADIQSH
ncbi:MAG: hypothetical protein WC247_14680 [Porticoccaceae bacterium]